MASEEGSIRTSCRSDCQIFASGRALFSSKVRCCWEGGIRVSSIKPWLLVAAAGKTPIWQTRCLLSNLVMSSLRAISSKACFRFVLPEAAAKCTGNTGGVAKRSCCCAPVWKAESTALSLLLHIPVPQWVLLRILLAALVHVQQSQEAMSSPSRRIRPLDACEQVRVPVPI